MAERRERKIAKMAEELTPSANGDDLGLKPDYDYDQDNRDLGLSSEDIQATSRVLARLYNQNISDTVYPVLLGNIKPALEVQLGHALKREETDQEEAEKSEEERKARRRTLGRLGAVIGGIVIGIPLYNAFLSPEAFEQYAKLQRENKQRFEQSNTLGLNPSTISTKGWRIRYPALDNRYNYIPIEGRDTVFIVDKDFYIKLPATHTLFGSEFVTRDDTDVMITDYKRSDGVSVPKLKIREGRDEEEWILRDQPASQIDNKVVIFENVEDNVINYLSITKSRPSSSSFQIQVMARIRR